MSINLTVDESREVFEGLLSAGFEGYTRNRAGYRGVIKYGEVRNDSGRKRRAFVDCHPVSRDQDGRLVFWAKFGYQEYIAGQWVGEPKQFSGFKATPEEAVEDLYSAWIEVIAEANRNLLHFKRTPLPEWLNDEKF